MVCIDEIKERLYDLWNESLYERIKNERTAKTWKDGCIIVHACMHEWMHTKNGYGRKERMHLSDNTSWCVIHWQGMICMKYRNEADFEHLCTWLLVCGYAYMYTRVHIYRKTWTDSQWKELQWNEYIAASVSGAGLKSNDTRTYNVWTGVRKVLGFT